MIDYELKNIDPDDISDILVKIEKSFDIKFGDTELIQILTFGEMRLFQCESRDAVFKARKLISEAMNKKLIYYRR